MQVPAHELDPLSRDRRVRLDRAADPATPVAELFVLAMEFPEQVASNPALAMALAADPCCIDGVNAVALACLLTSPELPSAVAQALGLLVRGPDRAPSAYWAGGARLSIIDEYLDAWRSAGSIMLAVDTSAIAPAAEGVPADVERLTRGQILLARRLGWTGYSSWYSRCDAVDPSVRMHAAAGEDQCFDLQILWPNWSSVGPCECSVDFLSANPGRARVSWSKTPAQADVTICFDSVDSATASILLTSDSGDEDHWELMLDPEGLAMASGVLAPLRRLAAAIAADGFVVVAGHGVAVGDIHQVTEGINCALDENGPGRDEVDDDDGSDAVSSPTELVSFVRKLCPMEGAWFASDDGSALLECLEGASEDALVVKFGGPDAIAEVCQSAFERLIPAANAHTAGREVLSMQDGRREFELAMCNGGGALVLGFYGFRWCASCEEREIQLDGVVAIPQ